MKANTINTLCSLKKERDFHKHNEDNTRDKECFIVIPTQDCQQNQRLTTISGFVDSLVLNIYNLQVVFDNPFMKLSK